MNQKKFNYIAKTLFFNKGVVKLIGVAFLAIMFMPVPTEEVGVVAQIYSPSQQTATQPVQIENAPEPELAPAPAPVVSTAKKVIQKDILKCNSKLSEYEATLLATKIENTAKTYNVPALLFASVLKHESDYDNTVVSHADAHGIGQLTDETVDELNRKHNAQITNVRDIDQNLKGSAIYLSFLMKKFNGNTDLVLAAYNAGPNRVSPSKGIPNIPETKAYVRKINSHIVNLQNL